MITQAGIIFVLILLIAGKFADMPKWVKGQSGNPKGAPKGGNPGAGRPPDKFKTLCSQILEESEGAEFMGKVVRGEDIPQLATSSGEVIPIVASVKDRMFAVNWLADRVYGKPDQHLDATSSGERIFQSIPVEDLPLLKEYIASRISESLGSRDAGKVGK